MLILLAVAMLIVGWVLGFAFRDIHSTFGTGSCGHDREIAFLRDRNKEIMLKITQLQKENDE